MRAGLIIAIVKNILEFIPAQIVTQTVNGKLLAGRMQEIFQINIVSRFRFPVSRWQIPWQ
jgi:hypothetical protein